MGLDLMRALAKIFMIDWTNKFKEKLKIIQENSQKELKLNLSLEAFSIYVDDESNVQTPTPIGAKFDAKEMKIVIDEDLKNIDKNLQKDRRTANLMVQIANTVDKSIVMEADFKNGKLPLLNSQV